MTFNNKLYDFLKFLAMIVLPALSALYLGLGQLWGWPATEQVVATFVLLDTFLGAILQLSSVKYRNDPAHADGFLSSTGSDPDTGIPNLQMVLTTPPDELMSSKNVRLMVARPPKQ